MTTSGERLKALLRECDLTPSDFAAQRKLTAQHINNWFRRGVPLARLEEIADLFCVHVRWLRCGEGPKHPDPLIAAPSGTRQAAWPTPLLGLNSTGVPLPFCQLNQGKLTPSPDYYQPVPHQALERVRVASRHACCIDMPDNNMAPLLPQGALLAIDRSFTRVVEGEYYALLHNGQLRVNQLSRGHNGTLCLHSHDRLNYPMQRYTPQQRKAQRLEILGWVFWWSCLRPARPG